MGATTQMNVSADQSVGLTHPPRGISESYEQCLLHAIVVHPPAANIDGSFQ